MQDNKYDKYIYGGLISVFVIGLLLSFKKKVIFGLSALGWSKSTNFFTTTKGINLSAIASKGGIKLSRNFGKENALMCGLNNIKNEDFIITIDADLQHLCCVMMLLFLVCSC